MRRTFKKKRGLWLPLLGDNGYIDESGQTSRHPAWGLDFGITTGTSRSMVTAFEALVPDASNPNPALATGGINELSESITQYGYMCRRILGDIKIAIAQVANDTWCDMSVTAGIFVADSDEVDINYPSGVRTDPLVSTLSDEDLANGQKYSPDANETVTFPWMWIRNWWLANSASSNSNNQHFGAEPNNFTLAAGIKNGPWVDVKTRRHVKPGQRLFLAVSVRSMDGLFGATFTNTTTVRVKTNLRMYASLTRPRRGGTF